MTSVFEVAGSSEPTSVTFNLQPEKVGLLKGRVGLDDREPLSFGQFDYL